MNEETLKLIKLINENKTLTEITSAMNLSKRQLFQRMAMIRQNGYLIDRKYYYNGTIEYALSNPFNIDKTTETTIETPNDMRTTRMILTSDSHYGNIRENLICTDKMFDYCAKEDIHLILHLGDFFEGVAQNSLNEQKYKSTEEQIHQVLAKYPLVDNMLTVTLLGNHDASFWLDAGIDIKTILENRRHDIIPIGYEQGIVNIGNYQFVLKHPIVRGNIRGTSYDFAKMSRIFLHGHSHRFKVIDQDYKLNIYVPSSSNMENENRENTMFLGTGIPSIIDAEFIAESNETTTAIFKQYILINDNLVKIGEYTTNAQINRIPTTNRNMRTLTPYLSTCFDMEEQEKIIEETKTPVEKPKVKVKSQDEYRGMSQTEKFNARYGIEY